MPHKVRVGRNFAIRPILWHPQAEILTIIIKVLREVDKLGECWRWLERWQQAFTFPDYPSLNDQAPLTLIDTIEGAQDVLAHAIAYRDYKLELKP